MGNGEPNGGSNIPDKEWGYPSPNSVSKLLLNLVCSLKVRYLNNKLWCALSEVMFTLMHHL